MRNQTPKPRNGIRIVIIRRVLLFLIMVNLFILGFVTSENTNWNPFINPVNEKPHYATVFNPTVIEQLNHYWEKSGDLEFAVCLVGYEDNGPVYVNNVSDYTLGDNVSVQYYPCSLEKEVGTLHKHPNEVKYPSHDDLYSSYQDFYLYDNYINVIMFGVNDFNVMTPGKFWGSELEVENEQEN